MSEDQELRDRISAIHRKVREDPEIIKRKWKRARKLSRITSEMLHRILRGSTPKEAET